MEEEWTEYADEGGNFYYYNNYTGEVSYPQNDYQYADEFEDEQPSKESVVVAQIRDCFAELDPEQNGFVELTQLDLLAQKVGKKLSPQEIKDGMYDLDTTGEMVIYEKDFVEWWLKNHVVEEIVVQEADITVHDDIWEEIEDQRNDTVYYYNSITEEMIWELPELVEKIWKKVNESMDEQNSCGDMDVNMDMKISETFARFDVDSTGTWDLDEFQDFISSLNLKESIKHDKLAELMKTFGVDHDNLINYEEFLYWWRMNVPQKKRIILEGSLSENWEKVEHFSENKIYYHNMSTGVTSWHTPDICQNMLNLLEKKFPPKKASDLDEELPLDEKVREIFSEYDTKNQNFMSNVDLKEILEVLQQKIHTKKQLQEILSHLNYSESVDEFNQPYLSKEDFCTWWLVEIEEYERKKAEFHDEIWIEQTDDEGNVYYYNTYTGDSQWDNPFFASKLEELLNDKYCSQDLTEDEKLRRLFNLYDTDGSGYIDLNEFKRLAEAIGQPINSRSMGSIMKNIDDSGDCKISLEEFIQWYVKKKAKEDYEDKVMELSKLEKLRETCVLHVQPLRIKVEESQFIDCIDSNQVPRLAKILGREIRGKLLLKAYKDLQKLRDDYIQSRINIDHRLILLDDFTQWYNQYNTNCEREIQKAREEARAKEATDEWEEVFDEEGKGYYINKRTGEKQWESVELRGKMKGILSKLPNQDHGSDDINSIRQVFKKYDQDGSGDISKEEFGKLMCELGCDLNESQMDTAVKSLDTSGDGFIDINEFINWWLIFQRKTLRPVTPAPVADSIGISKEDQMAELNDKLVKTEVKNAMEKLIEDVIAITPLLLPDAAARVQRCFRARQARRQLFLAMQDRYNRFKDEVTGEYYYVNKLTGETRWDKPLLLGGNDDILSPRSQYKLKKSRSLNFAKKKWFDKYEFSKELAKDSTRIYFRSAAFLYYGVLCTVEQLLKKGVWASLYGKTHIRTILIVRKRGNQLYIKDKNNYLPIHHVVRYNFPNAVLKCMLDIDNSLVLETDSFGQTPLHLGARDKADFATMKILLRTTAGKKACLAKSISGYTPLQLAFEYGASKKVIELLIASSPKSLMDCNNKLQYPLHTFLSRYCRLFERMDIQKRILMIILDNQGPIICSKKEKSGNSPLHIAVQNCLDESVVLKLFHTYRDAVYIKNNPLGKRNKKQLTPLHLALQNSSLYSTSLIEEFFVHLQKKETVCRNSFGYSLLQYAIFQGVRLEIIKLFLKLDFESAKTKNDFGDLPLHTALKVSSFDSIEIIKLLLEAYPEGLVERNNNDECPIHTAVLSGVKGHVELILRACPWSIKTRMHGEDPLMIASKMKSCNPEVMDMLLADYGKHTITSTDYNNISSSSCPFYYSTMSSLKNVDILVELNKLDQVDNSDMIELARRKLRANHHHPKPTWEFSKILKLKLLFESSEKIQLRSILAIYQKLQTESKTLNADDDLFELIEKYDLVRLIHKTMYKYQNNTRMQYLGRGCLYILLPTIFAVTKYKHSIDPFFNIELY